jgi:hypothetical protein
MNGPVDEPAQRPQTVAEIMTSIYARAEVVQVGPEHYRVTAPLETIPRMVKARDCTLPPTCKVEFFEQSVPQCLDGLGLQRLDHGP